MCSIPSLVCVCVDIVCVVGVCVLMCSIPLLVWVCVDIVCCGYVCVDRCVLSHH